MVSCPGIADVEKITCGLLNMEWVEMVNHLVSVPAMPMSGYRAIVRYCRHGVIGHGYKGRPTPLGLHGQGYLQCCLGQLQPPVSLYWAHVLVAMLVYPLPLPLSPSLTACLPGFLCGAANLKVVCQGVMSFCALGLSAPESSP